MLSQFFHPAKAGLLPPDRDLFPVIVNVESPAVISFTVSVNDRPAAQGKTSKGIGFVEIPKPAPGDTVKMTLGDKREKNQVMPNKADKMTFNFKVLIR